MLKKIMFTLGGCIAALMVIAMLIPKEAAEREAKRAEESKAKKEREETKTEAATAKPLSDAELKQAFPVGSQWNYVTDEDKMGRKRTFAHITSSNMLQFDFPYNGPQRGTLLIRKAAQSGTNVILRIERGQFVCGIDSCSLNVRFDKGPIQHFSASEPTDHSTTTLFLNNEGRFISQLRKAKTLLIEATFYQEGRHTLEFDTEGFKWQ